MTPHAFAKRDCANFFPEGCLLTSLYEGCRLALTPPQRCPYFERAVLPLADQDSPNDEPQLQKLRLQARNDYLANTQEPDRAILSRPCPLCSQPMAKRRRFCPDCAKKRRHDSYAKQRRAARHS